MKKLFSLFMSLAMLLSLSAGVLAVETETLPVNTVPLPTSIAEQINKEQPAIDAYEEIHIGLGIVDPSNPVFPNYPDTFGGAYYADEKLHISLTDNTRQTQLEYIALVSDPTILVFESAEYSYNELYAASLLIANEIGSSISSVSVDMINNEISVGLPFQQATAQRQSIEAEITAANRTDLPVNFAYEAKSSASDEIIGGQEITWPGYSGTLTICGTWQGSPAILTAGHCVNVGTTYRVGGDILGTGAFRRYDMDQFYDYGVIRYTGTNFTHTNKVLNNANYTTITSTLTSSSGLANTTVCKYGKKTAFSTGEIDKVNAIVNYGDVVLYGMTKVIIPDYDESSSPTIGAKGDSGGPVYSGHKLYGIYSGDGSVVNSSGTITKKSDHFWYSPIYGAAGFTVKTTA